MKVTPCAGYHAKVENSNVLHMPDGRSVFKLYYVSIVGRDNPERFDWNKCPISKADFEQRFLASAQEGIGFVTVFPHIFKVFRYSPKSEILMLVKAYWTPTWEPVNLDRGEGFMEFACLAEAMLAEREYAAWAAASSVDEYLASICGTMDAPVVSANKLLTYWER